MKTDNLTAAEAELYLLNGYKVQPIDDDWSKDDYAYLKDGDFWSKKRNVALQNGWTIKEWLEEGEIDGKKNTYRLVTTDEDVAKWRETQGKFGTTFIELGEVTQSYWRDEYASHLATLPELTEGKQGETFDPNKVANFKSTTDATPIQPSATVSDEVIGKWNDNTPHKQSFDYLSSEQKELVRQAYHKAHEKVEQKVEAPQAYKFPYKLAVHDNFNLQFVSPENVVVRMGDLDGEDLQFICEAINEKLNRK